MSITPTAPTKSDIYDLIEHLYSEINPDYEPISYTYQEETAHWTDYSKAIKGVIKQWTEDLEETPNPYIVLEYKADKQGFEITLGERNDYKRLPYCWFGKDALSRD